MQYSQKLDGILRAPVHSTFSLLIQGLVTVRTYDRAAYFKQDFNNNLEKGANATFCFNVVNRWMGLRLDLVCVVFTIFVTIIAFIQRGYVNSELLILSIQSMTDVISFFSVSFRMYAELDNFMTSPQRLYQYAQLKSEPDLELEIDKDLGKLDEDLGERKWPT